MTRAEIITIGTELLLGEIQDTKTHFLASQLRQLGIDLFRVTTVGDNTLRIADMIRESLSRADIIITTGGLGPTIDDPTRNAAALAFNVEMIFHAELWEKINDRFQARGVVPSENNRKQAYLPASAIAIDNPVGTAPAFYLWDQTKMVVCLPGVPAEMETIFLSSVIPILKEHFTLADIIKTKVLHTTGIGESEVDNLIADLETSENPTLGLSAHPANVDIRITAKAGTEEEADKMIESFEDLVIQRLPDVIFGVDTDTLQQKIAALAEEKRRVIKLYVHGNSSRLFSKPDIKLRKWIKCFVMDKPFTITGSPSNTNENDYFAANFLSNADIVTLELFYIQGDRHEVKVRTYNGPPAQTEQWMANTCMDFVWHKLKEM